MNYLITRKEHFKNERLSKNLKTITIGNYDKLFNVSSLNEILDSDLITNYKKINDNLYSFFTVSKQKYRLDIILKNEKNIGLVNHIAFSLYERTESNYDILTNKKEMIEVLNRIKFIINDLVTNFNIINYFCIGGTELESKNNIYEYVLFILLGEYGYEKKYTDLYDSNWGLYFKI